MRAVVVGGVRAVAGTSATSPTSMTARSEVAGTRTCIQLLDRFLMGTTLSVLAARATRRIPASRSPSGLGCQVPGPRGWLLKGQVPLVRRTSVCSTRPPREFAKILGNISVRRDVEIVLPALPFEVVSPDPRGGGGPRRGDSQPLFAPAYCCGPRDSLRASAVRTRRAYDATARSGGESGRGDPARTQPVTWHRRRSGSRRRVGLIRLGLSSASGDAGVPGAVPCHQGTESELASVDGPPYFLISATTALNWAFGP